MLKKLVLTTKQQFFFINSSNHPKIPINNKKHFEDMKYFSI